MNALILLLAIAVLALLGSRLFVIVGVATSLCFALWANDGDLVLQLDRIVTKMEGLTTKNVFLSIPFFIASGSIMTRGGIARRLTDLARALVGWLPGGLAVAAIVACIVFAAISGSSPVTLVAVGAVMFPALVASGYPERFSVGLIASAGSLGCMIPPAISMLIYAISVQGSTGGVDPSDLFFAGLLPALLIAGMLAAYAVAVGLKIPGSRQPFSASELMAATRRASWSLSLPALVLGGIYGGVFTPTEAGAMAFAAAIVISSFVHGDVEWKQLPAILAEAATLIGTLILIVVLAFGLNDFLAEIDAPGVIRSWVEQANLSAFEFMLLVNVVLIVLGALMDSVSATLVFAPILAPVAINHYGLDPIHFGVVFVVNMEIGYLAPPVATNLFVASAIFRMPFAQVARAIVPTLSIICAALVVLMYVPVLSTGPLAWKEDRPVWSTFPWDGGRVVEAPPETAPAAAVTGGPKSMQEMMAEAKAKVAAEGAATPAEGPPKPKTLQEMMAEAKAKVAAEDQAAATPSPGVEGATPSPEGVEP